MGSIAWGGEPQSRSAIIVGRRAGAGLNRQSLTAAGLRVIANLGFEEASAELAWRPAPDVLIIDATGEATASLEGALGWAPALAADGATMLIVATDLDQLDSLSGPLMEIDGHVLCEPGPADWARALLAEGSDSAMRLHDRHRGGDDDEVAERVSALAEELRRLADKSHLHQIAQPDDKTTIVKDIKRALFSRRLRAQYFTETLFADPAWDMLLDLYVAHLERRKVSVSSVCIAAAVPKTTALRWIKNLELVDLIRRSPDADDRRRTYIMLSDMGTAAMDLYVASARRAGLPIA